MALDSMQEIFERAEAEAIPFWRVVLETDMEERQVTEAQSWEKMRQTWEAMLESAVSYRAEQRSRSGLVGGDGARMRAYAASGKAYSGDYVQEVIACIPPPASARSSVSGPALPVRPAAVRRRSALPPPWRQGRWPLSGAATASRSAMPRPWH